MDGIPLCIPSLDECELKAVEEVLRSGWLAHGPKNTEFEQGFAEYVGVPHAVSMNSCTSALFLALVGMGIEGEVITPSFTFVATVNAILLAGATPVLVDIDPDTRNIDPECIRQAITEKTEALMVVHYGGLPADMSRIIPVAEENGLRIIEDSAECLGGSCCGRMAGAYDVGCFSFFPTKNITTGEGGMLTTGDAELAQKVRILCAHGIDSTTYAREKKEKPWIRIASLHGFNFRLSNILAALGVEQLKKIASLNDARTELANRYRDRLGSIPAIRMQKVPPGFIHSWQMFTILVPEEKRDSLLHLLRSKKIGASVHFDPPVHLQPAYADVRRGSSLTETERVARSVISLPIFPGMTLADVDQVCEAIRDSDIL